MAKQSSRRLPKPEGNSVSVYELLKQLGELKPSDRQRGMTMGAMEASASLLAVSSKEKSK